MNQRAFLFDMDGVLVDSEGAWIPHQSTFSTSLFGEDIYKKIGSTVGLSIDDIYHRAAKHGFNMELSKFYEIYDKQAEIIYDSAKTTEGLKELIGYLRRHNFKIGLVSSSRQYWIDLGITKAGIADQFDLILSLNDSDELRSKPHPDGYNFAMVELGTTPTNTFILEDSNFGIAAAKASGAYTIGFTQHLTPAYEQKGADSYAAGTSEVISILEDIARLSRPSSLQR